MECSLYRHFHEHVYVIQGSGFVAEHHLQHPEKAWILGGLKFKEGPASQGRETNRLMSAIL